MRPTKIVVRTRVSAKQCAKWKGKHPTPDHYSFVIENDTDVYGADGTFIIGYRKNCISEAALNESYEAYHWMRRFKSDNRGVYAGETRIPDVTKDGRVSRQTRTSNVSSCVAGYFEAQGGRHPFCRQTAILQNHPEKWEQIQNCIKEVAGVYKSVHPDKYKTQMDYVDRTDPAWVIDETPFTTLTINNSVAAAYHTDGGDLKDGLGCMLCFRKGEYEGSQLVVPEYKFAVNMKHGDVIVFNPCIWHGNVPFSNMVGEAPEDWERITVVHYYREGIQGCLSPEEELQKAKNRGALF